MSSAENVARSLPCRQCGNRIAADALRATLVCPYCNAERAVDPEMLREAQAYGERVGGLAERAREEQRQVEAWRQTGAASPGPHPMLVAFPVGMVGAVLGGIAYSMVLDAGVVSQTFSFLGPFVALGSGGLCGLTAGLVTHRLTRRERRTHAVAENEARCPQCGAPNAFRPGQTIDTCKYCGSGLVASPETMEAGVAAARDAAARAAMERYRTERIGMVNLYAMSARSARPLFLGRRSWDRFASALGALAADDGQVLLGHGAIAGWLNRYWPGPYRVFDLVTGKASLGAAMRLDGYPVLVFADDGPMSGAVEPKVHLFVAAVVDPQPTPPTAEVQSLRRSAGELEIQEAGILLRMSEDRVEAIQERPERLSELRPVLEKMIDVARAIAAPPARPV